MAGASRPLPNRVDPFGAYDGGWGAAANGTKVVMTVPAIGGTQRSLFPQTLAAADGRVYVAGTVASDDVQTDFALVRLAGDTIFADAFDF